MRKLLSFALALIMVLALAVPAIAAPTGFISGTVTATDKNGYDSFNGKEITANNSGADYGGFSFVADNKVLNAWYIDVTDDISGTLEVAYKAGSNYYIVTFAIDGPGKYGIAESKGSNGANMVKIGVLGTSHDCDWGDWEVSRAVQCLHDGEETRVCKTDASHVETRAIPAPGHNNDGYEIEIPATCESTGFGWIVCTGCGRTIPDIIPALGHDYDDGVITTLPTETEKGIITYTCQRDGCGDTYTEEFNYNLTVRFFWKDTYGWPEDFLNTKISSFNPGGVDLLNVEGVKTTVQINDLDYLRIVWTINLYIPVGTVIENIGVTYNDATNEWYFGDHRCYVHGALLTIDDGTPYRIQFEHDPINLTVEEGVHHTIDIMLAVDAPEYDPIIII